MAGAGFAAVDGGGYERRHASASLHRNPASVRMEAAAVSTAGGIKATGCFTAGGGSRQWYLHEHRWRGIQESECLAREAEDRPRATGEVLGGGRGA